MLQLDSSLDGNPGEITVEYVKFVQDLLNVTALGE